MKHRPVTRAPLAPVALSVDEPALSPPPAKSEPSATQRAWLDDLRRISELHAELAAVTADLVQNIEAAVAVGAEQSVHADVPPNEPTQPELLSTKDMTTLLRCDARTLRRRELLGEIPAPIRQARIKRWRRNDVYSWLEENSR